MSKAKPKADEPLKVAGQTVRLEAPARAVHRLGLIALMNDRRITQNHQTLQLLSAAALMLCWPTGQAKAAVQYGHNMLEYGADVLDRLVEIGAENGVPEDEIMSQVFRAGTAAFALVRGSLPTAKHMEGAEGNSEARPDGVSARSSG
jgi:hypothetical protein